MNFGFTEEQELLRKTARDFLAERAAMKRVREVMEGDATRDDALWGEMAQLGWTGLGLPESCGGSGLSAIELAVVVEELGRCLAPVPFVPTQLAAQALLLAGDAAQQAEWLPRIAAGEASATLAVAEASGRDEPGEVALEAARSGDGWRLSGEKLFVPDAGDAELIVVAARAGGAVGDERGIALFAVPRGAPGSKVERQRSMDRLRPIYRVVLDGVTLPASALLGGNDDAGAVLRRILDRALVVLCPEMVGGAEKCLEDSVAYAKERVQFGKPIGVNQAIKHKCADMLFAVESARSITYYAAWAAREETGDAALAASMAKAYASDAYRRVAAENIQIHGGVGFTWEYDCHLYFKRAKSDESWLGDAAAHRARVADLLRI